MSKIKITSQKASAILDSTAARQTPHSLASRREFLQNTGRLAAASALAGVAIPFVHAAGSDTIQVALVGCGGRGTGAAANALATRSGPIKLIAMADLFEERLKGSLEVLKEAGTRQEGSADRWVMGFKASQVDVPPGPPVSRL